MRNLLLTFAIGISTVSAADSSKQPAPKEVVRKAVPSSQNAAEQVQKPAPFTDQELRVIRNAALMPVPQLAELLVAFQKRGNEAMTQILAHQILKRAPQQPDALRVMTPAPDEEIRPANYIEVVVKDLRAGKKVDDPEAIILAAHALREDGHAADAVALLEKLRAVNYAHEHFPFIEDLAYSHRDAGQPDKAKAAFESVVKDPAADAETRHEAGVELDTIALEKRIGGIRERSKASPEEGVTLAAKLLLEMPGSPPAVAIRIETLERAGRNAELAQVLGEMKSKDKGKTFIYQDSLANAYAQMKEYDKARAAFRELITDPNSDTEDVAEAQKMIALISLSQKLEHGAAALKRKDYALAKNILDGMEKQFADSSEVNSFRAQWMAKTGHANEALTMLLNNKDKAARAHTLFKQQDALAEIYVERREFKRAILAYEDMLHTTGYDEESLADARKGLAETRRAQLIDQGDRAIKNGDLRTAREIGEALLLLAPSDPAARTYQAELKLASGHPAEAYAELSEIKAKTPLGETFSGQDSLGDTLNHMGRWESASAAYSEVLQQPGYSQDDAFTAAIKRRALLPFIKNSLTLDSEFVSEEQGRAWREKLLYTSSWWNNWRATVTVRDDSLSTKGRSLFATRSSSRFEGQAAIQRRFEGGYFAEASMGGAVDNVLYGARIGKLAAQGVSWSLGFSGNQRADGYSIPLEELNGRQNRVTFNAAAPINERVSFTIEAFANWLRIGSQSVGRGYGGTGSLGYTLQQETRLLPEISISYVGEYSRFNAASQLPQKVINDLSTNPEQIRRALGADQSLRRALPADQDLKAALPANFGNEIFAELAAREVNRHGFEVTVRKHIRPTLTVFAQAGPYFDFVDHSWNYTAAAGLEYWLSDSSMLFAEIRYDSEGRGANSGSGVWEANLGAQMTF